MKDFVGLCLLEALRAAEHILPIPAVYALYYASAFHRIWREQGVPLRAWPACLGWPTRAPNPFRRAMRDAADHALEFFSDRLCHPRWQRRCRIIGLERLRAARERGPVVLAFMHTGPYFLTGFWLRAQGIPVAILRHGSIRHRSRLKRRNDRYLPLPAVPNLLYMDQLRDFTRVFAAGGTLLISIDAWGGPSVKLMDVPLGNGTIRPMPTGPLRLAARHGAELFPCAIVEEGRWRYRIEVGRAVPREHLTGHPGFIAAGRHLLKELAPPLFPPAISPAASQT